MVKNLPANAGDLGADVHEDRGLDGAMGTGELAAAGFALGFQKLKHTLSLLVLNVS